MIVVAVLAILIAVSVPNYLKAGQISKKTVCINNLKQISNAVDQWVIEHNASRGMVPSAQQEEEIYLYIKNGKPTCPSGGTYEIYSIGTVPQVGCSKAEDGHTLLNNDSSQ